MNILQRLSMVPIITMVTAVGVAVAVEPAQAATLCYCYEVNRPGVPKSLYNGSWLFGVSLDTVMNKITFTVKGSNSPSGGKFNGTMYMYGVTESNGTYSFHGTNNRLTMSGEFTPSTHTLIIKSPITSTSSGGQEIPFNVKPCPEPTSTIGLLALGTLGAASTLKRKLKSTKSTGKETTKVG
ncbi:MAG: PEP-CTERM sorting domain-containing protein [Microcystis sp.]|jgi:hypothetical protein